MVRPGAKGGARARVVVSAWVWGGVCVRSKVCVSVGLRRLA